MAVYYCHDCGRYVDDDWHPMDDEGACPDCVERNEVEAEDQANDETIKKEVNHGS